MLRVNSVLEAFAFALGTYVPFLSFPSLTFIRSSNIKWSRSLSQYKQTHRLQVPPISHRSSITHNPITPDGLPWESHTLHPQSSVRYTRCISPLHLLSFLVPHTHRACPPTHPPPVQPVLHWFSFTSQSKFITGDKGLPFSFLLGENKLDRSKIRQTPGCDESDPWRVWAPFILGGGVRVSWTYGKDRPTWGVSREKWVYRHGGQQESKCSEIQWLRSKGTNLENDLKCSGSGTFIFNIYESKQQLYFVRIILLIIKLWTDTSLTHSSEKKFKRSTLESYFCA